MVSRFIASVVFSYWLSCGLASADERSTELVPSCADIDAQRDTQTPELRARALQRLTRVLERGQLLVVTTGCVDRYFVSHEQVDGALLVRIAGPHGARRIRNGSVDRLDAMYARMVASLLEPPEPEPQPAPAEQTNAAEPDTAHAEADVETSALDPYQDPYRATDQYPAIDAVALEDLEVVPDRIFYGQLALGSLGSGFGFGHRRHAAERLAMDASLTYVGGDGASGLAFSVEALYVPHPRDSFTPYVGGGLSLASQSDGYMIGEGMRAEMTAGLSFSRSGASRWFTQIDAALPMFSLQSYEGGRTYSPSVSLALGLGF